MATAGTAIHVVMIRGRRLSKPQKQLGQHDSKTIFLENCPSMPILRSDVVCLTKGRKNCPPPFILTFVTKTCISQTS